MPSKNSPELRAYRADWFRRARQDPSFRARERQRHRNYEARNRKAINFKLKCLKAGVRVTIAEARAYVEAM